MTRAAQVCLAGLCMGIPCASQQTGELHTFFKKHAQLTDKEIRAVEQGRAVAKMLRSSDPHEIYVFGAVNVSAKPEEYIKLATDVDRLRCLPQYLGATRFGQPPRLSDLDGFGFESKDVKSLRDCKVGD